MPGFEPFPALRYSTTDLAAVIAPPYDVLSDADVDALGGLSEDNVTHIDVPRGGDDRYRLAGQLLEEWRTTGVLTQDPAATFTIYRIRFTDAGGQARDLAGVLGGLEIVDEGAGGVLPHERTTPKASTDRLDLTRATTANLSPVWGLSLAQGLTALLAEPGELIGQVVDNGVEHTIERVNDRERIAAIRAQVSSDDVLIADGHHRYAISRTYRDEVRQATGRRDTPAEQTLAFVGELVADQLSVEAIHRLYAEVDVDQLRSALQRRFALEPITAPTPATLAAMEAEGFLVLITTAGAEKLTPLPGAFDGVRQLDGLWLEETLADVSADVTYQHGLDEVAEAVRSGAASAAILIRPVGVAEIERTAREGLLMPPKSTFFTPKLKTGFVLRTLTP